MLFRKTFLIGVAATAMLIALTTATARAERDVIARSACNPCRVGQTLSWHGTAYRVNWVRVRRRIGDQYMGGKADGIFMVLSLRLTDLKNRPSTILTDAVRIQTRSGATYTVSDKAFAVYDNGFTILENLQPQLPKTVIAVYDVPSNAVRGAKLRVEDLGTGGKAMILLGV